MIIIALTLDMISTFLSSSFPCVWRKLALTLEIFAENSACYGHYVQAMVFHDTGMDWSQYRTHIDETLEEAQEAAKECIQLWADIGDLGKLADAWAAFAAVDFYAGRNYERAMAKLRVARTLCQRAHGHLHPTKALIYFNMGYITHLVFRKPKDAAELFRKSLEIREQVLGLEHPFTAATRAELLRCEGPPRGSMTLISASLDSSMDDDAPDVNGVASDGVEATPPATPGHPEVAF